MQHGFIFPHSQAVQNTKGARPTGVEAILSRQRNDAPTWNLCNCFPRQGILLAYYNFDNAILGKGTTAAYFLEPTYRISRKTLFPFKGAAGLAYLTNPFDSIRNPANQSYSTAVSAYLLFGAGAWFRLNNHWWLNPSVNYQHVSNGGMKQPNKGINWPTAGISVSYQPLIRPYYRGTRLKEKYWRTYAPRWEVTAFGTSRRGYDANRNRIRSPLMGLAVQRAKQVGRISALTLSAEVYHDEELQNELTKASIKASPVKAGVMAGHEFILGKFLFSQRLGYYVFDQTPYFEKLFHRWGLHYRINQQFGAGFNLLAHSEVAEFIDLRLSYSFQKKPN
ncbi:hypothetical protein AAE02nite_30900 [Adhaeribacter aerolatus]|uniref:Acyloxyacyl hydrolase n=1 Tax=Adhaeribacter aerolatus TaxID=670289 RepID=A0A512B0D3_9BACT|nr:hypothetical protein AAE02nite_30900 [Adhaeribacter aerolatus]